LERFKNQACQWVPGSVYIPRTVSPNWESILSGQRSETRIKVKLIEMTLFQWQW
jgi:hypothetical protein